MEKVSTPDPSRRRQWSAFRFPLERIRRSLGCLVVAAELYAVEFGLAALDEPSSKIFIHCAAGVHRAPMMTLALLCSMGWKMVDAMRLIEARRPVVDFAEVYVGSVERFLEEQVSK